MSGIQGQELCGGKQLELLNPEPSTLNPKPLAIQSPGTSKDWDAYILQSHFKARNVGFFKGAVGFLHSTALSFELRGLKLFGLWVMGCEPETNFTPNPY